MGCIIGVDGGNTKTIALAATTRLIARRVNAIFTSPKDDSKLEHGKILPQGKINVNPRSSSSLLTRAL